MFSSQDFIKDVNTIPTQWMLQYYFELPYKLTGQTFKIKSLFNEKDKDPSMVFYWWRDRYVFKDFSSGKKGSTIEALMELFKMDFTATSNKIKSDYVKFSKEGDVESKINLDIVEYEWNVLSYKARNWNTLDADYFTKLNISSKLLSHYNIKPLASYRLEKRESISKETIEIYPITCKDYVYGFFKKDGTLYKVYRPYWRTMKFINFDSSYTQGSEQLNGFDTLVIASSLKDLLVLKSLRLRIDIIAPNSETNILSYDKIHNYKEQYESIVTLFDPDSSGIKSMETYLDRFDIPFCYLPFKNDGDLADMMKAKGKDFVLQEVVPKLDKAIEKYKLLKEENKDVVF
jgi:hypothetical protein